MAKETKKELEKKTETTTVEKLKKKEAKLSQGEKLLKWLLPGETTKETVKIWLKRGAKAAAGIGIGAIAGYAIGSRNGGNHEEPVSTESEPYEAPTEE